MRLNRRVAFCAAAVVAALVAAACGAQGGPGVYLGLSAPPGTELAVGRAASGAGAPGVSPVITAPNTVQAGDMAAFCRDWQTLLTVFQRMVQQAGATTVAAIKDLDSHFQRDAPSAILPSVNLVVQTNQRIVTDLSANPINVADFAQTWANPGYQLAVQQVGAYGFSHC
ncbi:MAG: hypothetical protein ACRDZ8_07390 [Acidimicrobiales bacterium]